MVPERSEQAPWWRVACPAKANLMLSVHGRRVDGFHDLTSVMVALEFGDRLLFRESAGGQDSLLCDDPAVPTGADNLILRAAECFRRATGLGASFEFQLEKRIPMGAGLGGGSSDAVSALRGLNAWAGEPLDRAALLRLAATLGSDCPFFVDAVPALLTGRGEQIEPLPAAIARRLSGQKLLLFGPPFGVATAWAYSRLARSGADYESPEAAGRRLAAFTSGGPVEGLLYNSFEGPVGAKYLAIPALLEELRAGGAACLMSGSGSVCFVWLGAAGASAGLLQRCREAWGPNLFCVESETLGADYACAPRVGG